MSSTKASKTEHLLISYLSGVLGLPAATDKFGNFIEVSAGTAYDFSVFTGAGYCNNPDFPFSARSFSKIFGKALELSLTSSMFDRSSPRYSFENLVVKYPFIATGEKRIYVKAFEAESDLRDFRGILCKSLPDSENCLILRVELWKRGFGLEPLLEFSAGQAFTKLGFIVENQTPLNSALGSPDFLAFRAKSLQSLLFKNAKVAGGNSLARLSAHSYLPLSDASALSTEATDLVIVGEAKVGGAKAKSQILKYLDSNFFDHAIFLTDSCSSIMSLEIPEFCTAGFTKLLDLRAQPEKPNPARDQKYFDWLGVVTLMHFFMGKRSESRAEFLRLYNKDEDYNSVPSLINQMGHAEFIQRIEAVSK